MRWPWDTTNEEKNVTVATMARANGAAKVNARPTTHPHRLGVTEVWEWVTPELAAEWLDLGYPDDRRIRQRTVERYASDMASARWPITHQGVAFDETGHRIDAQHRLWAIIDSGVAVWLLVVRGLPVEARVALDQGAVRSVPDIATAEWVTNAAIAIARRLMADGEVRVNASRTATLDFALSHEAAIRFALDGTGNEFSRASFRGAIAAAFYNEDREELAKLKVACQKGWDEDPSRATIVASAVRFLGSVRGMGGGGLRSRDEYLKCQRLIQAYVRHEKLAKVYTPSAPIYQLPSRGL